MTRLTYAQMEGYAVKAGWPKADAPVVAAIGEAESGGNTDAVNPTDNHGRQSSYGWLQISNGTHSPPSPNWADPATNAALGYAKWQAAGQSFRDWGTYDSGAYRAYLQGSTTPDLNVQGNPNAIAAEQTADASADCLLGFGGIPGTSWWNDIFGSGGNVGKACFITRSNARGFIGALLLAGGMIGASLGLGLLVALAGQRTPLGQAATAIVTRRAGVSLGAQEAAQAGQSRQAAQAQKAAQQAAQAQQRAAQRAAQQPRGRHAASGPNQPSTGRHSSTNPYANRPGP